MTLSRNWAILAAVANLAFAAIVIAIWYLAYWRFSAPVVLQDELMFSYLATVEPSLSPYSNTIFSAIYATTVTCGDGFLVCGRALNLYIWLTIAAVVSLIILRTKSIPVAILGLWVSTSVMSFFAISFLPEILYYSLAILALLSLIAAFESGKENWPYATASGLLFGFAMLVKPHAAFVLGIAVVILTILVAIGRERTGRRIIQVLYVGASAILTRVVIEIVTSDRNPMDFFAGYLGGGDPAPSFLYPLPIKEPETRETGAEVISNVLEASLIHYLLAGLLLYLPPLVLGLVLTYRTRTNVSFVILGLLVFSTTAFGMLLISYIFGAYISPGDDHSDRLLLRYSEFLVPMSWLFLVASLAQLRTPIRNLWALGTIPLWAGAVGIFMGGLNGVAFSTTDSLLLFSLSGSAITFVFFIIGATGAMLRASFHGEVLFTGSITMFTIALTVSSYGQIHNQSEYFVSEKTRWAPISSALDGLDDEEILFIGSKRATIASILLDAGKLEAKYGLMNGYSEIPSEWLEEHSFVVVSSEIYPPRDSREVISTEDGSVTVYELRSEDGILQDLFTESRSVSDFSDIGVVTDWGYWADGTESTITFREPVQAGDQLTLELIRHQLTVDEELIITVGSQPPIPVSLPVAGRLYEVELKAGVEDFDSLAIFYGDSVRIGYVEGMEDYSFGVGRIQKNTG